MSEPKRLYRSTENSKIMGVLGGMAEYFEVDVVLLRVLYVIATIFTGVVPGVIAYLLAALIMPVKPANSNKKE